MTGQACALSQKEFVEPAVGGAYNGVMAEPLSSVIPPEWLAEFKAAASRPLPLRMKYAFIKTYKPVMDDAEFRAFDTTEQYRQWCEANLPDWLGYGRV